MDPAALQAQLAAEQLKRHDAERQAQLAAQSVHRLGMQRSRVEEALKSQAMQAEAAAHTRTAQARAQLEDERAKMEEAHAAIVAGLQVDMEAQQARVQQELAKANALKEAVVASAVARTKAFAEQQALLRSQEHVEEVRVERGMTDQTADRLAREEDSSKAALELAMQSKPTKSKLQVSKIAKLS